MNSPNKLNFFLRTDLVCLRKNYSSIKKKRKKRRGNAPPTSPWQVLLEAFAMSLTTGPTIRSSSEAHCFECLYTFRPLLPLSSPEEVLMLLRTGDVGYLSQFGQWLTQIFSQSGSVYVLGIEIGVLRHRLKAKILGNFATFSFFFFCF